MKSRAEGAENRVISENVRENPDESDAHFNEADVVAGIAVIGGTVALSGVVAGSAVVAATGAAAVVAGGACYLLKG